MNACGISGYKLKTKQCHCIQNVIISRIIFSVIEIGCLDDKIHLQSRQKRQEGGERKKNNNKNCT